MHPATENKIILVTRPTRLEELIAKFNTESQAQFYIEHLGTDFSQYQNEHQKYSEAASNTESSLRQLGRVHRIDRAFLPTFLFGDHDVIVVLGQDGLVANTLKYLSNQFVIGVNPDPQRWDGVLLPFTVNDLSKIVPEVFHGKRPLKEVTMAQAELNTGECLYGVNDIFIGPKSHTSARYQIKFGSLSEQHSSSGIIVSTGLGSTGWLKSILAGATGVAHELGAGQVNNIGNFPWNAQCLYFSVREPFPSKSSSASLVFGKITPENPLMLTSQMPENGVIFSDGIESDFLHFHSGTQATIGIAKKRGMLVT